MKHKIFGFDIRKPGRLGCGASNFDSRVAPFKPEPPLGGPWLTFDKYINPSIFLHEDRANESAIEPHDQIIVPSGSNPGFDLFFLWDSAADMLVNYPFDESAKDAAFAYAWFDLSSVGLRPPEDETFEVLMERQTIDAPRPECPLIGYDITSLYFISALAGFDHSLTNPGVLRRVKTFTNDFGLLSPSLPSSDISKAVHLLQSELPEDPFFVVGIFLLWDHSGQITSHLSRTIDA